MAKESSNLVAEWFGHRVYPKVAEGEVALSDQRQARCPFLTRATQEERKCIKSITSKGVCTVSSTSNGPRQDWLVCPHRALDLSLLEDAVDRLYGVDESSSRLLIAASQLIRQDARHNIWQNVRAGGQTFIYFHEKLGGEISFSKTVRSPEMSLDLTLVEVHEENGLLTVGKYGIVELQTMEFHGSYREVVKKLNNALDMFYDNFHETVQANQRWLAEKIEGPNIANVFKRTFYQMMFKFHVGAQSDCAGVVLAIPIAVWQSWQHHLGKPDLQELGGYSTLYRPDAPANDTGHVPAWIYVYDLETSTSVTPSPLRILNRIATDADSISHYALKVAPQAAISEGGSVSLLPIRIRQRILRVWPSFALPYSD